MSVLARNAHRDEARLAPTFRLLPLASQVRKKFAQNFLFALAANALVKPAYILLIDRVVQVRAGSEAYGRYAALFNLATIFGVVLDFGLAQYATRRLTASADAVHSEVGPLLRARLGLSVVYATAVFIAATIAGFRGEALLLLAGILLVQTLAQTLLFLRACVAALQRFKTDALLSILDRALLIVGMGALLLSVRDTGGFWVEWFVAAQTACYTVAVVVAGFTLRRASGGVLRFASGGQAVWTAIRGAAPYAALIFCMALYTRVDMVMLERNVSAAEAGRYAAAFRLLDVGNMVGLTVAAILLPLFGRMLAEGSNTGPIVRAGVVMLFPLSVAAAAVSFFYGADIMRAFYPDTYAADTPGAVRLFFDGKMFGMLMLAFPALSLAAIYSTLLTATGALRTMTIIAAVGAAINVSLNVLLMPKGGANMTALVAVITQWAAAIAFTLAVTRLARLRYHFNWIFRQATLAIAVVTAVYGLRTVGVDWRIAAVCALGVAGSAAFVLRLVSVIEMKRLFKR